jgi:putative oxidoreductase
MLGCPMPYGRLRQREASYILQPNLRIITDTVQGNKKMQKFIPLIARTFLAIVFVRAGFDKAFVDFAGTQEQMASTGIPIPFVVLIFTIAFQILGGISLILGYKAKIGAILLIIFLIPATLVFHNPLIDPTQMIDFTKNLSILGGLLMVVAFGAGALSLDEKLYQSKGSYRLRD